MKNKLLFLGLVLGCQLTLLAQKKDEAIPVLEIPKFKMDEANKEVYYSEVVSVAGSNSELYTKALNWFKSYYKNPNEVIKEQKENESITGKGRFKLEDVNPKDGSKYPGGVMNYTIVISVKDGKYKYEISKINEQATSYLGIEKLIEDQKKNYRFLVANHLIQTENEITKTIKELKKAMNAPATLKKDDW